MIPAVTRTLVASPAKFNGYLEVRMEAKRFKLRKHYGGCYRTPSVNGRFGQIKKATNPTSWLAEIRDSETGAIIRYAGYWPTLKSANEEVASLLTR